MKKLLVCFLAAIFVITACSKDEGLNKNAKDEQRQEITITASQINESTKTIREADGKVFWKPGDEINVFFKSDGAKFTSTNTEDAAIVAFNGSLTISSIIGMTEGSDDDNCLWGLYPYDSDATFDGHSIITTLSNNQTGVAGTFADDLFITLARNNSFDLAFYNVLSGFKFTVTRDDISSIVFSGNNGETLTGKLKLAFGEDGKPCVQSISEGQTSITLTPENGTFETGKSYYFVFVPTNFTKGFSVYMNTTGNMEGAFIYENTIEFSRNVFKTKSSIDNDVVFIDSPSREPLTFISNGTSVISLQKHGSNLHSISVEYKVNDNSWEEYIIGNNITIYDGEALSFRSGKTNNTFFSTNALAYYNFVNQGEGTIIVKGNIMSLVEQNAASEIIPQNGYFFLGLFQGLSTLVSAKDLILPAKQLGTNCYCSMFAECKNLENAPELPAINLRYGCYQAMFSGCSNLKNAPELPASVLAPRCYALMFSSCSTLTSAPSLPASKMEEGCYYQMFSSCMSLIAAPELASVVLADNCYMQMFSNSKNLKYAPDLLATSLTKNCYFQMFYHTAIENPPMVYAESLAEGCCYGMFQECSNLKSAPDLMADKLIRNCYSNMFSGCTSLEYIKALFTTTPSNTYTENWVSGVSSTGTFVKSKDATWDVTGANGVPSGWTVKTYPQAPDESQIPSGRYLSYVANMTKSTAGGNYYVKRSYVQNPVSSIGTIEIQFQLSDVGDKSYSILCENEFRDDYDHLTINKNYIYGPNGSLALSALGLNATSPMTIRISTTEKTFKVNGQSTSYIFNDNLGSKTFFSSFCHKSDEGIWEEYGGLPDGSKMYYIKIWDSTGKLVYVGYPSSGMNPKTSQKERCWYSNYNGDETMEFPNFNSVSSYLQYGNYNVED